MVVTDKLDMIIKSSVGSYQVVKDHRNNSSRTGVFEILTSNKERMFVKIHNRLSRWNPEVYTYQNWVSAIYPYTPQLLHYFREDDLFGIIVTPIDGMTINEYKLTDDVKLENAYYQAGQVLRKLHDNFKGNIFGNPSVDTQKQKNRQTNAVEYVTDSLESLKNIGMDKCLLSESDISLVEWCMENSNVFLHSRPVPTNWDYTQNNWMVNDKGDFTGIIDFENMLWGLAMDSFGVMMERYTHNKPHLTKAIFQGYGLEINEQVENQLRIVGTKSAIAGIIYGKDINDDRIYSLARKRLDKLILGDSL